MDSASRRRPVALAVLLAVAAPLVVIAVSSGGDEGKPGGLRVERSPGAAQITVYVEDPELNSAATAAGRRRVTLECLDRAGKITASWRQAWPFTDTDQGTFDPHVHVSVDPPALERIARCRLRNTDPPLEGRLL
jgi:hypothetical protein